MTQTAAKQTPLPVKVVEDSFVQIPRFWFLAYDDEPPFFKGIPPSCVLLIQRLWSHCMNGNVERKADFSMRQFGIHKDDAAKWTRALEVSGLFEVGKGKYSPNAPQPTTFRYRVAATEADWRCFIAALREFLAHEAKERVDRRKKLDVFQAALAEHIDDKRRAHGLSALNEEFVKQAIREGKVKRRADGDLDAELEQRRDAK